MRIDPASFRDPSGFVFWHEGSAYRQINPVYDSTFQTFLDSGLYESLRRDKLIVPHEDADLSLSPDGQAARILKPRQVAFFSYPYEWSFSQLKDAALATLELQRRAIDKGLVLKDASAYNIQFVDGKPSLIDTLSFDAYQEGQPWVAYKQFCQHFLAPLALMAYTDVRLGRLLTLYLDGVPLDLAVSMLPGRARLRPGLLLHLYTHAASQKRLAGSSTRDRQASVSKNAMLGLIDSLRSVIDKLTWEPDQTAWADYYDGDSYDDAGFQQKQAIVEEFLTAIQPEAVWDLGANTGVYSRIAAGQGAEVVAWDVDPGAVERNYREVKAKGETTILPLLLDLTAPSPGIGWANRERQSFSERGRTDVVLALALIHHLAITNNLPLPLIAQHFAELAPTLIIEFVPKDDPKVQTLLISREDIFPDYNVGGFEAAFSEIYRVEETRPIDSSSRRLYRMRRKD